MNNTGFRVLVAEDEATFGLTVARALKNLNHDVKVCPTGKATLKSLDTTEWDVLLLDLKLPDADGVDILTTVRKEHPELQTIIVTGFANVQSAIETMRLGAFDYLTKPPNFEELGMRVEKAGEKTLLERENRRLRFQVQRNLSSNILTKSPVLKKVLRTIEMVAAARTPCLIEGESGVGKELVAQYVHRTSPRTNKGFVDLNCAAVPSSLLESELFGFERGAFTGAGNEKPGLVEVADGGTLFLDEVGEMVPEIQSKFLRVLDSGTFYRVGATKKRRADFRLVCATNRDLKGEVAAGRFRKDLFYRINGVKVVIPPLRQRPEDIPLLVDHFARQLPNQKIFASAALAALSAYDWPGNVRELHFAVERAVLLAEGEKIELRDLPPEIVEKTGRMPAAAAAVPAASLEPDDDIEFGESSPDDIVIPTPSGGEGPDAERVRAALEKAKWRREQAAEILGVSPRTLYRWIKKLDL
jgi:two-component system response regulator AtoC